MLVVASFRFLDLHFHSFVHAMRGAYGETPRPPLLASVTLILSLNFPGNVMYSKSIFELLAGKLNE